MAAPGLEAAIDDGLLDTKFRVISFETIAFDSMGNAMPEVSDGANFSQRQKQVFRSLSRGKRFFISRIRAAGPDGTTRDYPQWKSLSIDKSHNPTTQFI